LIVIISSCGNTSKKQSDEVNTNRSATDTCDAPDPDVNCNFLDMPEELNSVMNIAVPGEPGEPIIISGRFLRSDSVSPLKDLIIYAFQTDSSGYYSKKGNETGVRKWHGSLYGWCKTDSNGIYEIRTIRPGRYPSNDFPAHIHAVIKKPDGSSPFYINDFVFWDDSLVDEKYISSLREPGGSGVVELERSNDGIMRGKRDIILSDYSPYFGFLY
jgi:protocatechuate 3,4-dioxygenase beta subunit